MSTLRRDGAAGESGPAAMPKQQQFFTGRGHKISLDNEALGAAYPGEAPSSSRDDEVAVRMLTFWSDGFTLAEEGPLYEYSDPKNQRLLAMMQSGYNHTQGSSG